MDADGLAQSLRKFGSSPLRIAISGWPAVGKTTVSRKIASRLRDALHIQAESWLHSKDYREARALSGSNLHAYSLSTAVDELNQLLVRHESVQLGDYQHHAGRIVSKTEVSRKGDAPYILDGTMFYATTFETLVDLTFFIFPRNHDQWFEFAVQRDVKERGFNLDDAQKKNQAKRKDMKALEVMATHSQRVQWALSATGSFTYELCPRETA